MNNYRSAGPGGPRQRSEFIGGRPRSDADYSVKKNFANKKPFGNNRSNERKRSVGNHDGNRRETENFKTICTKCGGQAEVPFKPNGSKPVFCRDCFSSQAVDYAKSPRPVPFSNTKPTRRFDRNSEPSHLENRSGSDYKSLLNKINNLESKIDAILTILNTNEHKSVAKQDPE